MSAPASAAPLPASAAKTAAEVLAPLVEATLDALQTLREVMAHARRAAADQPLPKALNQARIAAGQVLRIAARYLTPPTPSAPTPKPDAAAAANPGSSTRPSLSGLLTDEQIAITELTQMLNRSTASIPRHAAPTPATPAGLASRAGA